MSDKLSNGDQNNTCWVNLISVLISPTQTLLYKEHESKCIA